MGNEKIEAKQSESSKNAHIAYRNLTSALKLAPVQEMATKSLSAVVFSLTDNHQEIVMITVFISNVVLFRIGE